MLSEIRTSTEESSFVRSHVLNYLVDPPTGQALRVEGAETILRPSPTAATGVWERHAC